MQIMGACSIFSMGGQIRGMETKVPPSRVQGWNPRGSEDKAPRSRRQVVKIMHNNSSTERIAETTNA